MFSEFSLAELSIVIVIIIPGDTCFVWKLLKSDNVPAVADWLRCFALPFVGDKLCHGCRYRSDARCRCVTFSFADRTCCIDIGGVPYVLFHFVVLVAFRRKFRDHIALRPSELWSVGERWSISSHPHGSQLRLAHYVAPQPPQAPSTLTTKDLEKIRVVERTYPGRSLDFFDLYPSRSTEKLRPIRVPRRIPRSSTAILEALAETVGRDPTAPHYRYMDGEFNPCNRSKSGQICATPPPRYDNQSLL